MTTLSNATFASHYPVTGEVIADYPIFDREQVHASVARARAASRAWQELGFKGRRKVLLQWSNLLITKLDEITAIVSRETGKPVSDAKLEAALAVGHLGWAARHAEGVMRTSHRSPGALMANAVSPIKPLVLPFSLSLTMAVPKPARGSRAARAASGWISTLS